LLAQYPGNFPRTRWIAATELATSFPLGPLLNAWYSAAGYESMDLCAWLALSYKIDKNGNYYSVLTKGHEYLTQMGFELNEKTRSGTVPGTCENIYKNIH